MPIIIESVFQEEGLSSNGHPIFKIKFGLSNSFEQEDPFIKSLCKLSLTTAGAGEPSCFTQSSHIRNKVKNLIFHGNTYVVGLMDAIRQCVRAESFKDVGTAEQRSSFEDIVDPPKTFTDSDTEMDWFHQFVMFVIDLSGKLPDQTQAQAALAHFVLYCVWPIRSIQKVQLTKFVKGWDIPNKPELKEVKGDKGLGYWYFKKEVLDRIILEVVGSSPIDVAIDLYWKKQNAKATAPEALKFTIDMLKNSSIISNDLLERIDNFVNIDFGNGHPDPQLLRALLEYPIIAFEHDGKILEPTKGSILKALYDYLVSKKVDPIGFFNAKELQGMWSEEQAAASPSKVGRMLKVEKFCFLMSLGKSKTSIVVLAHPLNKPLNLFAIKIQYATVKEFKKDILREILCGGSVDAPNILKTVGYEILNTKFDMDKERVIYAIFQQVGGPTLTAEIEKFVSETSTDDIKDTSNFLVVLADIMGQLCDGVFELHTKNLMHRDIKPDNIVAAIEPVIRDDGSIDYTSVYKLIDFGCGKEEINSEDEPTMNMGTRGYIGPNQGRTPQDVYALGAVLRKLIQGNLGPGSPGLRKMAKNFKKSLPNAPDEATDALASMAYCSQHHDEFHWDIGHLRNAIKYFRHAAESGDWSSISGQMLQVNMMPELQSDVATSMGVVDESQDVASPATSMGEEDVSDTAEETTDEPAGERTTKTKNSGIGRVISSVDLDPRQLFGDVNEEVDRRQFSILHDIGTAAVWWLTVILVAKNWYLILGSANTLIDSFWFGQLQPLLLWVIKALASTLENNRERLIQAMPVFAIIVYMIHLFFTLNK